jgi:acyl carrier protein
MSNLHSIKQFIIEEFVPDSHSEDLPNDLDLLQSGILDSLAVLRLVAFIEDHFDITLEPDEIDPENLKSINAIDALISEKSALAIS